MTPGVYPDHAKFTHCPNRKGNPRIPWAVCEFHIAEKDRVCFKRNSKRQLVCPTAKAIKEGQNAR